MQEVSGWYAPSLNPLAESECGRPPPPPTPRYSAPPASCSTLARGASARAAARAAGHVPSRVCGRRPGRGAGLGPCRAPHPPDLTLPGGGSASGPLRGALAAAPLAQAPRRRPREGGDGFGWAPEGEQASAPRSEELITFRRLLHSGSRPAALVLVRHRAARSLPHTSDTAPPRRGAARRNLLPRAWCPTLRIDTALSIDTTLRCRGVWLAATVVLAGAPD